MRIRNYLLLAGFLGCGLLGGWAGWRLHPSCPVPSQVDTRTKIRWIDRKPDGSSTERIEEQERIVKPAPVSQPKWSAGIRAVSSVYKLSEPRYELDLHRRVGDTNLWLGVGGTSQKEVLIGIRLDF
jgi:hypothetical protein